MHAQERDERRVLRDLDGKPRLLTWFPDPKSNDLRRLVKPYYSFASPPTAPLLQRTPLRYIRRPSQQRILQVALALLRISERQPHPSKCGCTRTAHA